MHFSILHNLNNRMVFHTGGYGGPGHNSDGSGDEHANGTRSSRGSFDRGSRGNSSESAQKPLKKVETVVAEGAINPKEVKATLHGVPSQELSPGDIDPRNGKTVGGVDEFGRPTYYEGPGYSGPSQEFSPEDLNPVTADFHTGERRLLEYVLGPILRYRDESLRER